MPSLSNNRFSCLDIEEIDDKISEQQVSQDVLSHITKKTWTSPLQLPNWEKKLPKKLRIAATPSPHSLDLKVEIQTTDTVETAMVTTLLDSGATGLFLDTLMQVNVA